MPHREAEIVINGVTLTHAQSMAVRVAVTSFLMDLPDRLADLGEIGPLYEARLGEVQDIIVDPLNEDRERERKRAAEKAKAG